MSDYKFEAGATNFLMNIWSVSDRITHEVQPDGSTHGLCELCLDAKGATPMKITDESKIAARFRGVEKRLRAFVPVMPDDDVFCGNCVIASVLMCEAADEMIEQQREIEGLRERLTVNDAMAGRFIRATDFEVAPDCNDPECNCHAEHYEAVKRGLQAALEQP